MLEKKQQKYPISPNLFSLTERQIITLDQEVTGGEGWNCYCHGYITHTTVFRNKIAGKCKDFNEDHYVEVEVDDAQITTFCSTCRQGEICVHVIALLYCWIYDNEGFLNIGESLNDLESWEKNELIEIIARMVFKDPRNLSLIDNTFEDGEDYDLDGLFN